jgi:ribosomal protein L11 methyltransferase
MKYRAITIGFESQHYELIEIAIAVLSRLPVEGIEELPGKLVVYMKENDYDRRSLESYMTAIPGSDKPVIITDEAVPDINWNKEWEKNFNPIVILDQCLIKAPFHNLSFHGPYEIIIEPKMSFGTGHHETTQLMIEAMLTLDFQMKKVFDIGCGTGILAILASKMGASEVIAVDNDEWAYRNSMENVRRNHADNVDIFHGTPDKITVSRFDVVLANINLNVLIAMTGFISDRLKTSAMVLMSGIFNEDIEILENYATEHHLKKIKTMVKNRWALITFQKI